jgi:sporulation protein YabP
MEEKSLGVENRIILTNREEMSILGVLEVISFDEEAILLETSMGMLEIKGLQLHVNQLNLENGQMSLSGEIFSLEYDDKHHEKGGGSLISRLFS